MKGSPMISKLTFLKTHFYQTIILVFICCFSLGCSKYSNEVQTNLTKLKKTKACSGCDLSGIELISFDLKNADISSANLTGANLSRSDLTGANLTDTNLSGADLLGVNLTGATLTNTNLTGVKLSYADISEVEMSNVMLAGEKLITQK